ncbi:MAG: hypothetical protein WKF31_07495 [Thermoleophilaceae bacterium]
MSEMMATSISDRRLLAQVDDYVRAWRRQRTPKRAKSPSKEATSAPSLDRERREMGVGVRQVSGRPGRVEHPGQQGQVPAPSAEHQGRRPAEPRLGHLRPPAPPVSG